MQAALPEFEVVGWEPGAPATGARYAIVWAPPKEVFEVEKNLEAIFNLGAGVDALLALPNLPDIPLFRLQDAGMSSQMTEYVTYHLASLSRGFATYAEHQRQAHWQQLPPPSYRNWPVGVMGLGLLGRHVAQAVAALGYPVAGWARSPRQLDGVEAFHGAAQFKRFLNRTRVLVNLLPLTEDTRGIINHELLASLMPDSVIINIARGGHVVDEDLLKALNAGRIQLAVLDVFNQEPLPAEHPYWSHPKVRVTPHVAAVTLDDHAAEQISQGIRSLAQGQTPGGLVSRDTGY
ncbi:MAG: glyoxylate/hydroxypyruvate reductase A [Alcaligenaceae bacterium]|nr:glyoxylate/hydroxypyruvate reductase A [Alcaligenaceae bacterium]